MKPLRWILGTGIVLSVLSVLYLLYVLIASLCGAAMLSAGSSALAAEGETEIKDADCVDISYPEFYRELERLTR